MSHKWLRVVLAMSSLAGGVAGAGSPVPVVRPLVERDTRIEVTSTRGLESGSWVLIEAGEVGASWPRELLQVQVADERHLELLRPLVHVPRASDAQLTLLPVVREAEGSGVQWLDSPRQHDRVLVGGALPVEGEAPSGTQVLVFVDGVEEARWVSDASGRFAGTVEMPLNPGDHQVQVARELEGTWTLRSEPVTVVSMAAPPPPMVDEPVNGSFTNNQRPLFRGTGQATTRVTVSISGAEVGSTDVDPFGNWSLTLASPLAEGFYSAEVRARFPGDAPSAPTVTNFTVDVTPPDTVFTDTPSPRTTAKTGQFNFQTGEFGSRYECSFENGPFEPCSRPYVFSTPLADGKHFFAVRGIDRASNVDPSPARFEWIVDTTPPVLEFVTRPPLQSNAVSSVFILRASEEVRNYQCTLDGVAWSQTYCGETTTVDNLTEGAHSLKVRVSDLVGLSQEISYAWNVDLTPPDKPVLVEPVAGSLLGSSTPRFSGTAESGATVRVVIGGSARCTDVVDGSGSWDCSPSSPLTTNPSYELALEVQDAAGNVNNQFTPIFFGVDVDPPDTFIDVPGTFASGTNGMVTRTASPAFGFRSTEEGVTYECSVNDVPVSCGELSTGGRLFEPGRYTLQVLARDRVGNADASPATQTWTYTPYLASGGGPSGCSAAGGSSLLPLVPLLAFLKRRRSRSSPRQTTRLGALVAALVALLVLPARAQGVDLQQYKPAPGSRDVLGVSSPEATPNGRLHVGVWFNYAHNPLVLRTTGDDKFVQSIVAGQLTADVVGSYTFFERFELGLAVPVTTQWGPAPGNLGVFIPENATGTGLGNLRLVPKVLLLRGDTLNLGLAGVVSLPTATSNQGFLGSDGWGFQPMLLGQWAASPQLRFLGNVGVRIQPERTMELINLGVGNELTYALGAHWSVADPGFFVQGSLAGAAALGSQRSSSIPLELLVAVGHASSSGMSVRFGGGPGLTNGYGTPNFRVFGSIDGFFGSSGPGPTPLVCKGQSDGDDDGDGAKNQEDQCPYVPGDLAADGCPKDAAAERINELRKFLENDALDKDRDGVRNYADACPDEKGAQKSGGCPDKDGDGIADKVDSCLTAAENFNRIRDGDGCPEELKKIPVKLSFAVESDVLDDNSLRELQKKVMDWVKDLPKGKQLAAVQATFPEDESKLMQSRIESVRKMLAGSIQTSQMDVERKGKLAKPIRGKESFEVPFILWSTSDQSVDKQLTLPRCAESAGVVARLIASHGSVTAGSEKKTLKDTDQVCAGESVSAGPESGAVLVLAGDVLRLAPDSQVMTDASDFQLKGRAELQGKPDKSLAGPEIFVPCDGPVVTNPSSLAWKSVPQAKGYLVHLSTGVAFASDVRFVSTGAERGDVQLKALELPAGKWFWRVLPVNEQGFTGQSSKIHSFEVVEAVVSSKG
jgi:hypothetical protein